MPHKIEGYQSPGIQVLTVEGTGLLIVATIEIKGCTFTGAALMKDENGLQRAISEARMHAEQDAEKSDFKLFRQQSSGGSGWSGRKGPGKQLDPAAQVDRGRIGGIFARGLKEHDWKRSEITDKIAVITGLPYCKDCEYQLTNQQASDLDGAIQRGEKAEPGQIPQSAKFAEKERLKKAASANGMSLDQLNAWLNKCRPGCHVGRITSDLAIDAAENLEKRANRVPAGGQA